MQELNKRKGINIFYKMPPKTMGGIYSYCDILECNHKKCMYYWKTRATKCPRCDELIPANGHFLYDKETNKIHPQCYGKGIQNAIAT